MTEEPKNKAIVLLSGGLDSTTCLAKAIEENVDPIALSFDYNQNNKAELENAKAITAHYNIPHKIIKFDLSQIGGSALTDSSIPVPSQEPTDKIPITWVPQRNSLFLTIAFAYAEVVGAKYVTIGANQVDYSGYPDCRDTFLQAMSDALNLGSKRFVEERKCTYLITPLLDSSKEEIVKEGLRLEAPIHLTRSCYNSHEKSCGTCETCRLRLAAFKAANRPDPISYEKIPFEYLLPGYTVHDPFNGTKLSVLRVSEAQIVVECEEETPMTLSKESYNHHFNFQEK